MPPLGYVFCGMAALLPVGLLSTIMNAMYRVRDSFAVTAITEGRGRHPTRLREGVTSKGCRPD
ncbi:MAG: hypothetical protein GKC07_03260 [Methanomicrobiales archaeon]|nr:hypothetical protein [Methanomicrobiales archaeon]